MNSETILRNQRLLLGLKQTDLARITRINQGYISQFETRMLPVGRKRGGRLARALGLTIGELFDLESGFALPLIGADHDD